MTTPEISDALGDYAIYIHEDNNTHQIELLDLNTPGTNLGVDFFASCNSNYEFKKRLKNAQELAELISYQPLSRLQAQILFCNIWSPMFLNSPPFYSFSYKQCQRIAAPFLHQIIPNMRLIWSISHAATFGPQRYIGYALPKLHTEGSITSINILLVQLQSNSDVITLILILLSFIQINFVITIPYLELCRRDIDKIPL